MPNVHNDAVPVGRPESTNAFDSPDGYSGQDYHVDRERAEGRRHPSGEVNADSDRDVLAQDARNIPAENGRRAWFDSATGEVHGSGSGAGGGNPGEDFDSDAQAGSGSLPSAEKNRDST